MSARHDLLDLHLPLHERIVAVLPPDADFTPQVTFVDAAGQHHVAVIPDMAHGDEYRMLGLAVLPDILREEHAVAAMLAHYGWHLEGDAVAGALAKGTRPRDHAWRREVCVVVAVDRAGCTYAYAPVVRGASAQMLGDWTRHDSDDPDVELESEAIDALRAGVVLACA